MYSLSAFWQSTTGYLTFAIRFSSNKDWLDLPTSLFILHLGFPPEQLSKQLYPRRADIYYSIRNYN